MTGDNEAVNRMRQRWGLRAKMSASYVLVTAAAVLVVEIVVAALVVPGLLSASPSQANLAAQHAAFEYANLVVDANARLGRLPTAEEIQLGEPGLTLAPGEARVAKGVARIPFVTGVRDGAAPMSLALLLDPGLTIVASSYPARYPVGARIDGPGVGALPVDAIVKFSGDRDLFDGQVTGPDGDVLMALAPVQRFTSKEVIAEKGGGKPVPALDLIGVVYVQVPMTAEVLAAATPVGDDPWDSFTGQLAGGAAVLLVALPVGAVFGLLSTRGLIRRLRRLATSTVAVADGQYQHRVPVSGTDEIALLEHNFNRMAARLSDAMVAERHLASAGERARIARELHDSISQDLFSMRLLAGGLRRALPADSPLSTQVEALERTATGTMHEMQALLLELRPIALQDAGLVPAIDELCQAYRDRLGVGFDTELEPVELDPAVEHAVLRIVQEALANAIKHARPNRITVRMRGVGGVVVVSIGDDGNGFDPARAAERHGMGLALMRERVAELGGAFRLESSPGAGTTVHIELPRRLP